MNDAEHISDEELEVYHLNTLPEPRLANVEEHLLWCQDCLDRLLATERYIEAVRKAAVRYGFDGEANLSFAGTFWSDSWVHNRSALTAPNGTGKHHILELALETRYGGD
jgi:hypothetical protein